MHIFLINLDRDTDRRALMVSQLASLGMDFEIVPAVYGAAMSMEERDRHYNDRKARWRGSRSLTSAEIGCALSHIGVYRAMIDRNITAALILEDDVHLSADLPRFLSEYEDALDVQRKDVCLLSSPAEGDESAADVRLLVDGRYRKLPYKAGWETSSYILTQAAARALLEELYPVAQVADDWRRMQRYRVVDVFIVAPALAMQQRLQFVSSTASDLERTMNSQRLFIVWYKIRRVRAVIWDFFYTAYRRWLTNRHGSVASET